MTEGPHMDPARVAERGHKQEHLHLAPPMVSFPCRRTAKGDGPGLEWVCVYSSAKPPLAVVSRYLVHQPPVLL